MCNQTVSLISAEIERTGIPTVCVMLLREVAEAVRPPRSLLVPFAHGYPLGRPHDPAMQASVITAALEMLEDDGAVPILREFAPSRPNARGSA